MIGNPSKIRNEGYRILTRGLGVVGTVVFLRQFENGSGNYTEERQATLSENPIEKIVDRIRERKMQGE